MANIDIKFENWKNRLLDLGKRNKLLNYKDTARGSLKITSPDYNELYDRIVRAENDISFPRYIPSDTELTEDGEEPANEYEYDYVHTNKSKVELQRVLRNLRNKAKTALEEQGVNMLYLSFGFLKWSEADHSNIIYSAPLVLVPVTLTIESITSPFVLHLHDDEIVLNPTLAYKLNNDFGITLPAFDENDSLDTLFEKIQKAVMENGWTVVPDVGLSLLSFLKINMYADLNRHKESLLANPIVRAIGGDATALHQIPDGISEYDFDRQDNPKNLFQIVDADSSQQEAILLAKKGVSFVLQGPPGTGKSQTITNIIAESLAEGKKILFVSEKMAALEVVHKRLAAAGLDDFCLVLHSYKANKRSILDQLEKVLSLGQKKAKISDEAFQKLDTLIQDKIKLNNYAKQVFTKVEPLGKTIYEANGIIANLDSYPDLIFAIPDIRNVSQDQYNRYFYYIEQFTRSIRKMTGDYKLNPWRGSNLNSVNNEFRHDTGSKLPVLISKLQKINLKINECNDLMSSDLPCSVDGIKRLIAILSSLENAREIPSSWILGNDILPLFDEITAFENLQSSNKQLLNSLSTEFINIGKANILHLSEKESLSSVSDVSALVSTLSNALSNSFPYNVWNNSDFDSVINLFRTAKETADKIQEITQEILSIYEKTIFELDFKAVRDRIKTEYNSIFKSLKKGYKEDKKALQLCRKEIVKKISHEELVETIEKLYEISQLQQWYTENSAILTELFGNIIFNEKSDFVNAETIMTSYLSLKKSLAFAQSLKQNYEKLEADKETLIAHYQFLYSGENTDWSTIRNSLNWASVFRMNVEKHKPSSIFVERICSSLDFAKTCYSKLSELKETINGINPEYDWFVSKFDNPSEFEIEEFYRLCDRIDACLNGMFYLEEWIDFRSARKTCFENGLKDFVHAVESNDLRTNEIVPVFKKRFFRLWLDAVMPEYPAVSMFRRKQQDDLIREFASLDKSQFSIAKDRIKFKLINELPSMEHFTSGVDEISILKKELKKQRKIMPIRKLFKAIPNLLLTLKPCLMMSPLSVSLFLEAETYKFDIVIFDEASQVFTENAIGAISRGKQVIIAGDSKQLPPTSFFQTTVAESEFDDESEEDEIDVYESILDEANMLPERTLQWHYRSRHESLIAFSNAKIYKNNLITFPSNIDNVADNGVEYIHVPGGFYDRGGKNGNIIEAQKVAELVFEHFKTQPSRSLGVIAFGEVQQMAIENALLAMRRSNQQFEAFFAENKDEPFFTKSLENVQGDERDTIIFSIGYAKDAAGVFRMQFGPLGKSGGERRLNVAITRAKYNIKLVGSILPEDIDVDRITAEGPKLLRAYIDYAINGEKSLLSAVTESDTVEHDSPFEEAVYNFLDRKGYKLATQVGCSGYRIDMAVKHPSVSGVYVLGIECDGAAYHSAKTARERDRLRQSVLESMGWKIYRIWSTDWIKDPVTEGQRLVEAIEDAIATYGGNDHLYTEETEIEDYVSIEDKPEEDYTPQNMYGFETISSYSFSSLPKDRYGYIDAKDAIELIVNNEYPIHYELLCQRMAGLYGNEKATVKIRREVDYNLQRMYSRIVRTGDYIYPYKYDSIPIRLPNSRKIQHISQQELATAMVSILKTCIGTTREALSAETAKVYGFMRMGPNIQVAMSEALEILIEQGYIEEVEGKLKLKIQ